MKTSVGARSWLLVALLSAIYVSYRTASSWNTFADGRAFYFGTRVVFSGRSPSNDLEIKREWARAGSPADCEPGLPDAVFNYPPSAAILFAPIAWMPFQIGIPFIAVLSLIACIVTVVLLVRSTPGWPSSWAWALGAYALMLPALMRNIHMKQSAAIVCATVAAAMYQSSRRKELSSGAFLGLALAKPTLTLSIFLLTVWRRRWIAAATAIVLFAAVNLLLAAPAGLPSVVADYRGTLSAMSAPGGVNDEMKTGWEPAISIINAKRLFFLLLGANRPLVGMATAGFAVITLAFLVYVLRFSEPSDSRAGHPLEVPLVMMAGLTLFYHRYHDLVALVFVMHGLLEYKLRYPGRASRAWGTAFVILLGLSFGTAGTAWSRPLDSVLTRLGMLPAGHYNSVVLAALLYALLWLAYRDGKEARAVDAPSAGGFDSSANVAVCREPAAQKVGIRTRP